MRSGPPNDLKSDKARDVWSGIIPKIYANGMPETDCQILVLFSQLRLYLDRGDWWVYPEGGSIPISTRVVLVRPKGAFFYSSQFGAIVIKGKSRAEINTVN